MDDILKVGGETLKSTRKGKKKFLVGGSPLQLSDGDFL